MFTLPSNAKDEELRAGVHTWLNLVASRDIQAAQDFLDAGPKSLSVKEFITRVKQLTSGGQVSASERIDWDKNVDELALDGPIDMVCRWLPGPETTGEHLGFIGEGFIGEIMYSIPVDGIWTEYDAYFFIRDFEGRLSLQLRDVIHITDED
jgi:hypothetical protein